MTTPEQARQPYAIGSDHWPGLAKLSEECGELVQAIGKLQAVGGESRAHWDGSHVVCHLEDEMADVRAALNFVAEMNKLDLKRMKARSRMKLERFLRWHRG